MTFGDLSESSQTERTLQDISAYKRSLENIAPKDLSQSYQGGG